MKILYYDCFAGISGDMNLGAMIDLGVEQQYLVDELQKLNLDGYHITFNREKRNGIEGTKAEVHTDHDHTHEDENSDDHVHKHQHGRDHAHEHDHKHHSKTHHHNQRNLQDIATIISSSSLNDRVKRISTAMFTLLAEAEAKVHAMPVDQIHFHEVGAIDSIIDIVGAAICYDYLNVDRVLCSSIELGGGFVNCKHGTIPVPAPATVEILKGKPTRQGTVKFETTTPTGAAILATLVDEYTDTPAFSIKTVAYGIGHRKMDIPNVLRVYLAETIEQQQSITHSSTSVMIESNIDDMNPELYSYVMERLFERGADDVFFIPITMKKTRPAIMMSVLCSKEKEADILDVLFTETSTLGVRKYPVGKEMLERKMSTVSTSFGDVSVKSAYFKGKLIKSKPEYEDCKRIAKQRNISIHDVYKEIATAMEKQKKSDM